MVKEYRVLIFVALNFHGLCYIFLVALVIRREQIFMGQATHENVSPMKLSLSTVQ